MLCKLGFGAEFWRVGPTVRTGQSHISRAFMCANTRLLYLSPNMSAPSRAHRCPAPWFPPKYWPLPSWLRLTSNQKCPSAFLFSCLSGQIHAHGRRPVWFLGLIWSDKKMNLFHQTNIRAYFDFVWPLLHELSRSSPKHFLIFLASDPTCAPPPSSSQREITLKQPEASCLHLSILVCTCVILATLVCSFLLLCTLVYTCLHLSALVFSCLLYSTHLDNFTNG